MDQEFRWRLMLRFMSLMLRGMAFMATRMVDEGSTTADRRKALLDYVKDIGEFQGSARNLGEQERKGHGSR